MAIQGRSCKALDQVVFIECAAIDFVKKENLNGGRKERIIKGRKK
jgi:hypothetical protein